MYEELKITCIFGRIINAFIDSMQKFIIVLIICTFFCGCSKIKNVNAHVDTIVEFDSISKPCLRLIEQSYDFGKVSQNKGIIEHVFEFENIGKKPLIIYEAKITCNCVSVYYDGKPVFMNQKGRLIVCLDTKKTRGYIHKKIFIRTNAVNSLDVIYIKAFVED